MNVNITTKKAQFLNQEKSESTERTVIETITIKDVHSISDMEDAFGQIEGFVGNLFQDEFEEVEHKIDSDGICFHVSKENDAWLKKWRDDVLNSMKLPDIPEQKGEAKEKKEPRLTDSEIVDKYRFAKVFGFHEFVKIDRNTDKYVECVNTYFNRVTIHKNGLEIDPSLQLTIIPYQAYKRILAETCAKINSSKPNPEPDPHDFLSNAKQPSAQAERFMDGLKERGNDPFPRSTKEQIGKSLEASHNIHMLIRELSLPGIGNDYIKHVRSLFELVMSQVPVIEDEKPKKK